MSNLNSLLFYIILFSISALFLFLSQYSKKKRNGATHFFALISLSIPILISGLRYEVGSDFHNYIRSFGRASINSYSDFLISGNMEVGFFTLQKIASWSNDPRMMFILASSITVIFVYLAIKSHDSKVFISVSFLMYLFILFPTSLNIMRQEIALAIVFYSLKFIFERKFSKFLFFNLLAASFHITALVIIPFYFMFSYFNGELSSKDKKFVLIRTIFTVVTLIFVINFDYFLSMLSNVGGFEKFDDYATQLDRGSNREILLKLLLFVVVLTFRRKLVEFDNRNKLYIFFLGIDILLTLVGFWNPFVKRVTLYFNVVQILVIPSIISILINKLEKYVVVSIILFYCLGYFVLVYYVLGQSKVIPYNINL